MMPIGSRKQPRKNSTAMVPMIRLIGPTPCATTNSEITSVKPVSARNRVSRLAPMAITKIAAVLTRVSRTASLIFSKVSVRCAKPMTKDRNAPTAPASVGVNTPANSPPNTPITSATTGQAPRNALIRSAQVTATASGGASDGDIRTRTRS